MQLSFLCFLLMSSLALAAPSSHITVLLQFDGPPATTTISALNHELQHILSSSHLPMELSVRTEPIAGSIDGDLVIFKMKGSCSMNALPVGAVSDERGPLAMTHTVNGDVLPFADVECDRVRECVQRTIGRGNPDSHQRQYGAALARVMAHELYHILARSTEHQTTGLTKKGLTSRELTTGSILLSDSAKDAIFVR